MDTPYQDRQSFSHVTGLLSLSSAEVSDPGSLTLNIIQQVSIKFWWHFILSEKRNNNFQSLFIGRSWSQEIGSLKSKQDERTIFQETEWAQGDMQ